MRLRQQLVLLAAAALAGVDRVFAVGGAGAVAAMAYGTASIPAVDRIVGPGNAYVAEAKLQVSGVVGIDSPAGPSELLVLADASATPAVVAREMLARDVWKETERCTPLDNVIDVHMARLRKRVDAGRAVKLIHTVRGVGFTVRDAEE